MAREEPIVLSTFSVSAAKDTGYRASNSVSASRIDTPIADLPLTVQAFTSEFVSDLGAQSLLDVMRFAPGVTGQGAGFSFGANQVTIRGFQTAPYRNGFASYIGSFAEAYNVERVEVVKGPSSLLYGNIAPGGLVNYLTKRPLAKDFATATATLGSWSTYRGELDVNRQIGDKVGVRLSGLYQEADSWVQLHQEQRIGVTPSVAWRIAPHVVLTLGYEYYATHENQPLTVPINGPVPLTGPLSVGTGGIGPYFPLPQEFSYTSDSDFRDTEINNYNAELTARVAGVDLRAAYYKFDGFAEQFLTGLALGRPAVQPGIANQLTGSGVFQWRRLRDERDYNDGEAVQVDAVRAWHVRGATIKTLAGYAHDVSRTTIEQRQGSPAQTLPDWNLNDPSTWNRHNLIPASFDLLPVVNANRFQRGETEAVYGLALASLFKDRLNLLSGVRRTTAKGYVDNRITMTRSGSYEQTVNSPQFGALAKLTKEVGIYASYSRSFVPQSGTRVINDVPQGPLPPIIGEGWDVGIKTDLMEGRVSSTIAYFNLENSGAYQQVFTPDPVTGQNQFTSVEAGVQSSKGVEMDGTFTPFPQWQIYASYAYIEARISSNRANPALVGSPLPAVARNTGNLWTKYAFTTGPAKGLSVGGGVNFTSRKLARVENLGLYLPSSTLLSVFAAYEWHTHAATWTTKVSVKNLTDEVYQESTFVRGTPRRLEISASVRF